MITFKQFITESREQRTKEISVDEAISLMKAHCMDAINAGSVLYRGGPQRPVMVGDTALGPDRVSASTFNYYTLFVDNSTSWSKFPKRSRSFIGSTSKDGAYDVGIGVCLMIPFDDAKIGVCPNSDFWISFEDRMTEGGDLSTFMDGVHRVFNDHRIEIPQNYEQLKTALKQVTYESTRACEGLKTINRTYCDEIAKMIDKYGTTLHDVFESILVPKGFDVCTPRQVHKYNNKNREVFLQGKAVFITTDTHHIKELDKLKEFFNSTNPIFSKAL